MGRNSDEFLVSVQSLPHVNLWVNQSLGRCVAVALYVVRFTDWPPSTESARTSGRYERYPRNGPSTGLDTPEPSSHPPKQDHRIEVVIGWFVEADDRFECMLLSPKLTSRSSRGVQFRFARALGRCC